MRFFVLNWYGQKNPSELLINHLKYFNFGFEFAEILKLSCILCILRIWAFLGNFRSAYYQYMDNFIQRIICKR
jgi:hypothetical protein